MWGSGYERKTGDVGGMRNVIKGGFVGVRVRGGGEEVGVGAGVEEC